MQIPDRVIIDNAGGPSVLVGGTVEAALNAALPLVSVMQADSCASIPLRSTCPLTGVMHILCRPGRRY